MLWVILGIMVLSLGCFGYAKHLESGNIDDNLGAVIPYGVGAALAVIAFVLMIIYLIVR